MSFDSTKLKTGIWWDQNLCIFETPGIVAPAQARLDFNSSPLTFNHVLFFTKKLSKSAKRNLIFHLKGRKATGLGLTDLDSPMAEFLSYIFYFSRFWSSSGVNQAQSWTKRANFGYLLFREKFEFFKDSSNTVFFSFSTTSGKNFSKIGPYFGELGPQKNPKISHFMNAPSP